MTYTFVKWDYLHFSELVFKDGIDLEQEVNYLGHL